MLSKSIFFLFIIFLVDLSSFAQSNVEKKYGELLDVDGNKYKTIKIGTQTWMAENLRTTKYRNGSSIENIEDDEEWIEDQKGAWCYYENEKSNNIPYGKLYNWYAVTNNKKICPKGWHIPSDEEWTVLINYLDPNAEGGDENNNAGGKMKSAGTQYWKSPNKGASNSSGFSGLPGGIRYEDGSFDDIGSIGEWWSSTSIRGKEVSAYTRDLDFDGNRVWRWDDSPLSIGLSVRCVKD